jgi:hypothetical protein
MEFLSLARLAPAILSYGCALKYDRNQQNFESRDAALAAVLRAMGVEARFWSFTSR